MSDEWLKRYYGREIDILNPVVIDEGKKFAIVKVTTNGAKGYSSIGYTLIKKSGSFQASSYMSLHEGQVTEADLQAMKAKLKNVEEQGHL